MTNASTEAHTREALVAKSIDELKEIAKGMKIKFHPNVKVESLIDRINQQPQSVVRDTMKHVAENPAAPVFDNTPDEVMAAIQPYLKEGFDVKFPDDGTWHFKYKGREECGNLKIPLRVIRNKAENVSRGALRLKSMGVDGTYSGYADQIIAG